MGTVTGVNIPVLSFVLLKEIHIIECHASVYGPSYEMGYWVVGEFMRFPHPMPTFEKGDFYFLLFLFSWGEMWEGGGWAGWSGVGGGGNGTTVIA